MNYQNGIEFNVSVEYLNGATVSSRIGDVDAKKICLNQLEMR